MLRSNYFTAHEAKGQNVTHVEKVSHDLHVLTLPRQIRYRHHSVRGGSRSLRRNHAFSPFLPVQLSVARSPGHIKTQHDFYLFLPQFVPIRRC